MKIYILIFTVIFFLSACTPEKNDSNLRNNKSEVSELIEQSEEYNDDRTKYTGEEDNQSIKYSITVPESYHKMYNGQQTFLYDSNGNDLYIFQGKADSKFNEYQESNYSQLTDKTYDNINLRGFQRINIAKRDAIRIKYTGEKNDIEYMICNYFIKDRTEMIKIQLQARDKHNYDLLISAAENIKIE